MFSNYTIVSIILCISTIIGGNTYVDKRDTNTFTHVVTLPVDLNHKVKPIVVGDSISLQGRILKDIMTAARLQSEKTMFLSRKSFLDYDLNNKIEFTESELHIMLDETGLSKYVNDFYVVQKSSRINILFLIAICALESAWGTSDLAVFKNNLCGYGANDSDPYLMAYNYNTERNCMYEVSYYLHTEYLTQGGTFFNGVTLEKVNIRYASDKKWYSKLNSIMLELKNKLDEVEE